MGRRNAWLSSSAPGQEGGSTAGIQMSAAPAPNTEGTGMPRGSVPTAVHRGLVLSLLKSGRRTVRVFSWEQNAPQLGSSEHIGLRRTNAALLQPQMLSAAPPSTQQCTACRQRCRDFGSGSTELGWRRSAHTVSFCCEL